MARRQAVSIVLTRNPDSTEVFLAERNPELKFFGGYYAFPGGTLDEDEANVEIRHADNMDRERIPYILAGAREIFEETGLLLTHGNRGIPKDKLDTYRRQLLADEISFGRILQQEGQYVDARDFHFICSILTPEFAPVRYDTQFYWLNLPEGAHPEIWPGELVAGEFISAEDAVARWASNTMLIVPPVIFMLRELQRHTVRIFGRHILNHANAYRQGKIHQIFFAPGVQLIPLKTRTLLPATHTNAYLVGHDQLYIIDPAPADATEQRRFWDYLDDRLAEGGEFKGILLTHHHSDHVGALSECQQRYDLPIMAHRKTAEKLPGVEFDRFLDEGDELDLGPTPDGRSGWKLNVYHTPGHASGHLAFKETRYDTVIVGDLLSTLSTIVISPPDGHLATYMHSLQRLQSIVEWMLYPGHGPAVRNGPEVVETYIQHRQEREQKLLEALSSRPQTIQQLVEKVYDDVDPAVWGLARHSLHAGLIKLMEEGTCRQEGDGFSQVT